MLEEYGNNRDEEWINLSNQTQIHKTALIAPWVRFGNNCIVHPYTIIGRIPDSSDALAREVKSQPKIITIGDNSIIGHHTIVFVNTNIGENCLIGDHAIIREGTRIGNNCLIGFHVSISYDCKIGDNCRFQNSTVFHGECGDGCFFGVGVICSSDKRIDLNNYQHIGSHPPKFGKRVLVGSGANILPEISIDDDAVIGAGALVVKNVEAGSLVLGPVAEAKIPHVWV